MNDNYTTDFFNVVTPEQLTSQSFIAEDGVKVVNLQMKAHNGSFEAMKKYALPYDAPFAFLWRITWEKEDEIYLSFIFSLNRKNPPSFAGGEEFKSKTVEIYLGRRDPIFPGGEDFQITYIAQISDVSSVLDNGITLVSLLEISSSNHLVAREKVIKWMPHQQAIDGRLNANDNSIQNSQTKLNESNKNDKLIKKSLSNLTINSFLFGNERIKYFPIIEELQRARSRYQKDKVTRNGRQFTEDMFHVCAFINYGTANLGDALKKGINSLRAYLATPCCDKGAILRFIDSLNFILLAPNSFNHYSRSTKSLIHNILNCKSTYVVYHANGWRFPLLFTEDVFSVLTYVYPRKYEKLLLSGPVERYHMISFHLNEANEYIEAMNNFLEETFITNSIQDIFTKQVFKKWLTPISNISNQYNIIYSQLKKSIKNYNELDYSIGAKNIEIVPSLELHDLMKLYQAYWKYRKEVYSSLRLIAKFPLEIGKFFMPMLSYHNGIITRIFHHYIDKLISEKSNVDTIDSFYSDIQKQLDTLIENLKSQYVNDDFDTIFGMDYIDENNYFIMSNIGLCNLVKSLLLNKSVLIKERHNAQIEQAKAEAAEKEAEENIGYICHNLKGQIPATVSKVDEVLKDTQISSKSKRMAKMVRNELLLLQETMSRESISYRPVPQDLLDDIKYAADSPNAKYLGTIIMEAIKQVMPNACDPRFDENAFKNFFGEDLETAQKVVGRIASVNNSDSKTLVGIIEEKFFNFSLKITEESDNLLIGNQNHSVTNLRTFLNELFHNAVKYVSELPRDKRTIEFTVDLKDDCLLIKMSNTYDAIRHNSRTHGGTQILNRLVNGFGAQVVEQPSQENIFSLSYRIPLK